MAADLPLALRRTPRRREQRGVGEAPRTPAPASQRKSSRASVVRKPATTRTVKSSRTAGKTVKSKAKASVAESVTSSSAGTDDATDDSITLVDEADDSITALDFDIPISSSRRSSSSGTGKRKRRPSVTSTTPGGANPAIKRARRQQQQTGSKRSNNNDDDDANNSSIVHILPLRTQILDDHIKRRIRRNGLSAEMNDAYGEKRARRERTLAELRRARDELRSRDAEIERLRELTALFEGGDHSHPHHHEMGEEEASRVQDLERELSRLREEFMGRRHGGNDDDDVQLSSSPPVPRGDDDDWGVMGGMSDGGSDAGGDFAQDFEDEFGESSVAELESGGTPGQHHHHRQRQQQQHLKGRKPAALHLHGPTLTPPSTSPTKLPSSPVRQIHSSGSSSTAGPRTTSACDAGVQAASVSADAASQACIPDPGMDALNDELSTLRAEVTSLNDTIQERDSQQARMGEKLAQRQLSSSPSSAQGNTAVDQDVELQLDIVLQDLADKTARLAELSSLLMSPPADDSNADDHKEATAELASALHSVRQALGDIDPDARLPPAAAPALALAADRLRELDTTLKQRTAELSDRDAALTSTNDQLAAAKATAAEKDARAKNLEADVAHLSDTISSLRDAVADLEATTASQQADLDGARDAALQQGAAAAEAESRLAEAIAKLASLGSKLSERETALRGREGEVETLKAALAEARAGVDRLRGDAAREKGAARDAVRAMRAQMVAALRVGEGFLGDDGVAKEEEEGVGGVGVVVSGVDKTARGRSDDSGLGLEGEGEGSLVV